MPSAQAPNDVVLLAAQACALLVEDEFGPLKLSSPEGQEALEAIIAANRTAVGPDQVRVALDQVLTIMRESGTTDKAALLNATGSLNDYLPVRLLPVEMNRVRLLNIHRMATLIGKADHRATEFAQGVPDPGPGDETTKRRLVMFEPALPITNGLAELGATLDFISENSARQMAKRIASAFAKQKRSTGHAVKTEVLSAIYEAFAFQLLARAGFAPDFLDGKGKPDIICREAKLLVECKDAQTPQIATSPMDNGVAAIRAKIADAEHQLEQFPSPYSFTPLVFADLPEGSCNELLTFTSNEHNEYWKAVLQRADRPQCVIFSDFDLYQHRQLLPGAVLPTGRPAVLWPTSTRMETPRIAEIRQRLQQVMEDKA